MIKKEDKKKTLNKKLRNTLINTLSDISFLYLVFVCLICMIPPCQVLFSTNFYVYYLHLIVFASF